MRRIGVLLGAAETDPDAQRRVAAFRKTIYDLGWVEGGSIQIGSALRLAMKASGAAMPPSSSTRRQTQS
jgi:hypothetical protein